MCCVHDAYYFNYVSDCPIICIPGRLQTNNYHILFNMYTNFMKKGLVQIYIVIRRKLDF